MRRSFPFCHCEAIVSMVIIISLAWSRCHQCGPPHEKIHCFVSNLSSEFYFFARIRHIWPVFFDNRFFNAKIIERNMRALYASEEKRVHSSQKYQKNGKCKSELRFNDRKAHLPDRAESRRKTDTKWKRVGSVFENGTEIPWKIL